MSTLNGTVGEEGDTVPSLPKDEMVALFVLCMICAILIRCCENSCQPSRVVDRADSNDIEKGHSEGAGSATDHPDDGAIARGGGSETDQAEVPGSATETDDGAREPGGEGVRGGRGSGDTRTELEERAAERGNASRKGSRPLWP